MDNQKKVKEFGFNFTNIITDIHFADYASFLLPSHLVFFYGLFTWCFWVEYVFFFDFIAYIDPATFPLAVFILGSFFLFVMYKLIITYWNMFEMLPDSLRLHFKKKFLKDTKRLNAFQIFLHYRLLIYRLNKKLIINLFKIIILIFFLYYIFLIFDVIHIKLIYRLPDIFFILYYYTLKHLFYFYIFYIFIYFIKCLILYINFYFICFYFSQIIYLILSYFFLYSDEDIYNILKENMSYYQLIQFLKQKTKFQIYLYYFDFWIFCLFLFFFIFICMILYYYYFYNIIIFNTFSKNIDFYGFFFYVFSISYILFLLPGIIYHIYKFLKNYKIHYQNIKTLFKQIKIKKNNFFLKKKLFFFIFFKKKLFLLHFFYNIIFFFNFCLNNDLFTVKTYYKIIFIKIIKKIFIIEKVEKFKKIKESIFLKKIDWMFNFAAFIFFILILLFFFGIIEYNFVLMKQDNGDYNELTFQTIYIEIFIIVCSFIGLSFYFLLGFLTFYIFIYNYLEKYYKDY